jgi:serine/threonine-protein kinase RsbT
MGFDRHDAEAIVLAVSELGTNLVRYAPGGVILVSALSGSRGTGIRVASDDTGPGIADVERALQDDFSTGGGLGSGLPAVQRLMDTFSIITSAAGTSIDASKWLKRPSPSR